MSISLEKIYDLLITRIGLLVIPRRGKDLEIRQLTNTKKGNYTNKQRDTSGTNVGAFQKANALFLEDVFADNAAWSVDLVRNGVIKTGGGVPEKVLNMLDLLSRGKLAEEEEYLKKLLNCSLIYRISKDHNLEQVNNDSDVIKEEVMTELEMRIQSKYCIEFENQKHEITEMIEKELRLMLNQYDTGIKKVIDVCELLLISISVCVCEFENENANKKREEIDFGQNRVKEYLLTRTSRLEQNELSSELMLYFERLWNECGTLSIRDSDDGRTQIEKYVYPNFTYGNEPRKNPTEIKQDKSWKRILIAESGLGKSSFVDMITGVSVYEDICNTIENRDESTHLKIQELNSFLSVNRKYIPILIRAGQFVHQSENDIKDLLQCIIGGPTRDQFEEWIQEINYQSDRRTLLLVDALDELELEERKYFVRLIDEFADSLMNVCVLATCRPIERTYLASSHLFRGMEEWRVEPFDRQQMRDFIFAKIKQDPNAKSVNADELLDGIIKNRYLKELASNPHMLEKMLIHGYYKGNRTGLSTIDFLVKDLISRRWDKLFLEFPLVEVSDFTIILSGIAYEMMRNEKISVEKAKLTDLFFRVSINAGMNDKFPEGMFREIVNKMNNAAGLLIFERDGYKFQYPVFLTYLAANWIYYQIGYLSSKKKYQESAAIDELVADNSINIQWRNTYVMLFSVFESELARNEITSMVLFQYLLCIGMGTDEPEVRNQIVGIFNDLKNCTFGNNNIVTSSLLSKCIDEYVKYVEG